MGHSPDAVTPVWGADGASWNNKCPRGVTFGFQVRKHVIEPHRYVPSNIFSNDPRRPDLPYKSHKFRPEVTASPLPRRFPALLKG